MRNSTYSSQLRHLRKKVLREHNQYRKHMMFSTIKDVYDNCNEIQFYECISEYFRYNEHIKPEYISACIKYTNVIRHLYELYIKYENLQVNTWEGIDELLDCLVYKQKSCLMAG